jgi:hypothetical protein
LGRLDIKKCKINDCKKSKFYASTTLTVDATDLIEVEN